MQNLRTSGSVAKDDYLEQIYHLREEKGYVRPIDLSERLGVSQTSVTNMVKKLHDQELVHHEKHRPIFLTETGQTIAKAIIERHQVLTRLLRLFNIDENVIHEDVEGMEHHLSSASFQAFQHITELLENNPELLAQTRTSLSS